jgi:hypothetical protein
LLAVTALALRIILPVLVAFVLGNWIGAWN